MHESTPNPSMYARLVLSFRLRLTQCGLSSYLPEEILSEAYLRLERALKMGQNVYNQEAWLRTTGFNYILEIRRNESKLTNLNIHNDVESAWFSSVHTPTKHSIGVEQLEGEESYQLLDKVMLELPKQERELLEMRFYENMSWDEIRRLYACRGEVISTDALRQRGSRAMKSLRKAYLDQIRFLL